MISSAGALPVDEDLSCGGVHLDATKLELWTEIEPSPGGCKVHLVASKAFDEEAVCNQLLGQKLAITRRGLVFAGSGITASFIDRIAATGFGSDLTSLGLCAVSLRSWYGMKHTFSGLKQLQLQDCTLSQEQIRVLCPKSVERLAFVRTSGLGSGLLRAIGDANSSLKELRLEHAGIEPVDLLPWRENLPPKLTQLRIVAAAERISLSINQIALLHLRAQRTLDMVSVNGEQWPTWRQIQESDEHWLRGIQLAFDALPEPVRLKLSRRHPTQGWDADGVRAFFTQQPLDLSGTQHVMFNAAELLDLFYVNPRATHVKVSVIDPPVEFFQELVRRLPRLESLEFVRCSISDLDLPASLAPAEPTSGRWFSRLQGRWAKSRETDSGAVQAPPAPSRERNTVGGLLAQLPKLSSLKFLGVQIAMDELSSLGRCVGLRELCIGPVAVLSSPQGQKQSVRPLHPDDLSFAAEFKFLQQFSLDLSNNKTLDKNAVYALQALCLLTSLDLRQTQFNSWDILALLASQQLQLLTRVSWTHSISNPNAVEALQRSRRLDLLTVADTRIYTQKNIEDDALWRHAALQAASKLSPASLALLKRMFPRVKAELRQDWAEHLLTQEKLAFFDGKAVLPVPCQQLREILAVNRRVRMLACALVDWDPQLFASLGRVLGRLESLTLFGHAMQEKPPALCTESGPGLIRGLKELNLLGMRLGPGDLEQLGQCASLKALSLMNSELPLAAEAGELLHGLAPLQQLRHLMLNGTRARAIDCAPLASRLQALAWTATAQLEGLKDQEALAKILSSERLARCEFQGMALTTAATKQHIKAFNTSMPTGDKAYASFQLQMTVQKAREAIAEAQLPFLDQALDLAYWRCYQLQSTRTKVYGIRLDASQHHHFSSGLTWQWLHQDLQLDSFGDMRESDSVLQATLKTKRGGVRIRVSWKALPDMHGNQGLQRRDVLALGEAELAELLSQIVGDLDRLGAEYGFESEAWSVTPLNKYWKKLRFSWDPQQKLLFLTR